MSNTPGSGNDYTDPHTHSFATESAAAPTVKKPNPIIKWVIILFGTFMLIAAGLMAWGFISKKPAPAPAPQVKSTPAADPAAPVADPAADPNATIDPLAAPADPNAVIDPMAVPADPNAVIDPMAVPTDPNAQIVDPSATVPAATPVLDANGLPVDPANPNVSPNGPAPVVADPAAVVVPAPVVPQPEVVTPPAPVVAPSATVVPAPAVAVVQDPANSSISQVMDTARQEMMSALDRIEKRLTDMENRFVSLEGRVGAIEGRPASSRPAVAQAKPAARKPARKPAARKPAARPVAPSYESQNRIEILDGSIAPVSRAIIIERDSSMDNQVQIIQAPEYAPAVRAATPNCRIQSIKPGRVWIRRADGSFATYGVGDVLPNGARADSIDPDAGVMANGRLWNCG